MLVEPTDLVNGHHTEGEPQDEAEVALRMLREGPTVRLGGVDQSRVLALMETGDRWSPIVVHRTTLQVIDGVHRVHAARALGRERVRCVLFDGDATEALVESVRRNLKHGTPLSLRERKVAAERILGQRPFWSDRLIAETVGLSATTIGALRQRCSRESSAGEDVRLGRDGKFRPQDALELRRRIMEELKANPAASLRAVASATGGSPETVRSVRKQMCNEEALSIQGVTTMRRPTTVDRSEGKAPRSAPWSYDTALQSTDAGRAFASWFARTDVDDEWLDFVWELPLSRTYEIAEAARRRARAWTQMAEAVEGRARQGRRVIA